MDKATRTQDARVRRMAQRRGLVAQRHRARDTGHLLYGTYQLTKPDSTVVAAKQHEAFGYTYGLSLDEAEAYLTDGRITGTSVIKAYRQREPRQPPYPEPTVIPVPDKTGEK